MRLGVLTAIVIAAPAAASAALPASGLRSQYLYNLSTLTGRLATGWLELSYDPHHREVYSVSQGLVRVFNTSGVEIYSFGGDAELGGVEGIAALEDGDLMVLSRTAGSWSLIRCNYRGEPLERTAPAVVPEGFQPDFIGSAKGQIYLASRVQMRLLVLGQTGTVLASHDLAQRIGLSEQERADTGISGFNVDGDGNVLFTIAPMFKAFVMAADGVVRSFGKPGGAPGRFNIANGIAGDERGNLYVADTLKGAVIVFDKDFNFLGEFSATGPRAGLRNPMGIVAGDGKVFVAQSGGRGVAVFEVVAP